MVNYKAFVDKYYPAASEPAQKNIARFLNNLTELLAATKVPEQAITDKTLLCKAFFLQDSNGVSRAHYQKIKGYLLNLFDFLGVQGTVPSREEVIASQADAGYFRGIEEIMEFIDSVGVAVRGENYNPTRDLVIVKSICVLGWMGFTTDEIAKMRKSALRPLGMDGYQIMHGVDVYEVSGAAFAALYYLSDLTEYKALPNGKPVQFAGDPSYLFRPAIRGTKICGNSISQSIKRFNTRIPPAFSQHTIVFRNLYRNARFLEIYSDTSDRPLQQKIMDAMGCTANYVFSYQEQYLHFVDLLEGNKI